MIKIERYNRDFDFAPRLKVIKDEEVILEYSLELLQDIKFGDWAGMFGKPDKMLTNEEVLTEMVAVLKNTISVTDEEIEIYKKEMMPYIDALSNKPPTELLNMPFTKD